MNMMNNNGSSLGYATLMDSLFSNMTIENRDIDTSGSGEEMLAWLGHSTPEAFYYFDSHPPNPSDCGDTG